MSLPYQPRFLYRRRRNSPIPSPYGEYITPRSGFDGFGGPSYTLGSLSNRPGSDWATPRYVRDEPDMFMAGMGDEPEDNGDGTYTLSDGTIISAAGLAAMQLGPTKTMQMMSASAWDVVKNEITKYGQAGLDLLKSKGTEIAQRVANGENPANVVSDVSGGLIKLPGGSTQFVEAPPPVYATKAEQLLNLMQQQGIAVVQPATIKSGTAAARFLPVSPLVATKSKIILILGAVAVGAFLLLKKK